MEFIFVLDILGVVAFSISGVLAAMRKGLDVFGILIIAFATSVGGGTLRDVLIDTDVSWLTNMTYVYVIIITTIFGIILRNKLNYLRKSLFLFDTLGIGLYTVVGVEKAISAGLPPVICVAFGTMSACFGGVIRDILCNDIPVIFHQEIYATACILGGFSYFALAYFNLPQDLIFIISGLIVIAIRISAVVFKISLPKVY
ncbi:trimeric intracellular cation channel family protein [Mesohalobacter halotolerans]|uniref:Trimeric intracellular cation channel family protein n=1 Tax=Mesohalobacter halotolerans TaxID=1883405 RepID=A0A4U5TSV3_9FLAO|nr:trimeric intracellular cation channel family protein [Mesohalobacter halotolerans]MBS3737769.1 trimeric intracellular cation channel family protein [Psychroflexus sp.]TKS56534.1 trimeric intracellular cation channel family protein [Mesohalobacter halotolerans]